MKIVVFGGAGFLGSHVCEKLSEAGHEVIVFDCIDSPWLSTNQQMVIGNILDTDLVDKTVKSAEIVYNFAGIADIDEANMRPADTVRVNILGNTLILDACRKYKIQRYVFASTVYVYSQSGGFYRCSKQACENYIETYHTQFGLEYSILRYGSLYGSRSDHRNSIFNFIKSAMSEGKIYYGGSPDALREYIHVEDAARCSVEILQERFANQNIVLTGHQSMRIGDLFKMIEEILGKSLEFNFHTKEDNAHYEITPYSFNPRIGLKLAPPLNIDFGQGILHIIEEIYKEHCTMNKD